MAALARWCLNRRFAVLGLWLAALVGLGSGWNWWLPARLERWLPRVSIEGPAEAVPDSGVSLMKFSESAHTVARYGDHQGR
jgi:hypothetical protein